MATDVLLALGLDKGSPSEKIFTIREVNGADSSFIASSIISYQIKNNNPTVLVCLHNLVSHYQSIGLKLNYNLNKQIECGLVKVIDFPEKLIDSVLNENSNVNTALEDLVHSIRDIVNSCQSGGKPVCVFLDGLSHLFDLGCDIPQVNRFCRSFVDFVDEFDHYFVCFQCFVGADEDSSSVMSNFLAHMSYTVVNVQNLSTGRSNDVSGHLVVRHPGWRFEAEHCSDLYIVPTHYHFKLFDRGIKLFAPGSL